MTTNATSDNWTYEEVENYLSHLSEAAFKNRTPEVVYHSAIIIVGVTGNSLVLLVYGFRFPPSAPRTFVLVMAVLDLITNIVALPLQIATIRHAYNDTNWRCRVFFGFSTISTAASAGVLLLVALDRFRRVCAPLKKQLNSRQALYLCLVCVFFMMIFYASFLPHSGVQRVNTSEPGVQARMCWSADEYKDTFYPTAFEITAGTMFFTGLALLVFFYTRIGITLWRRRAAKKTQPPRLQRVQDNGNVPETAASGTVNAIRQDNTSGRQDPHLRLGGGSITQVLAAVREGRSGNTFCESTSTENCSSNSASFSLDRTTLTGPEQAEVTAEGNGSERDTREHLQSQPECGISCRQDQRSGAHAGKERSDTMGQKDTLDRRIRSRTTLIMAVLTSFFVINWLPNFVVRNTRKGPTNLCDNFTDCGDNTYAILHRSYYLNSAINAFVYSFCSARFRNKCRHFFRGVVRKLSCSIEDSELKQSGRGNRKL